jgi:hypothetical protein
MRQLFKQEQLIGKTITQVIMPEGSDSDLWIKFTDDSFVVIQVVDRTQGFGQTQNVIVISDWEKDNTDKELVELGFITRYQYDQAIGDYEKILERDRLRRETENKERIEEYEKEQLAQLKAKYDI